jgi:hypothetical protein
VPRGTGHANLKFLYLQTVHNKGGFCLRIPILSGIVEGLRVFFRTKRYVAYTIVFFVTVFLSFFTSLLMTWTAGMPIQVTLVYFFAYLGSTGTIYFAIGSLLTGVGADRLWITRRGRGNVTELKGVAWIAVSFAISVFMSIIFEAKALLLFAMFCWVGWIAFQAFLSARTSLRVASIAEPKKGGILLGAGSFIILLIGLGIIALEALAALYLIPNDVFGLGTAIVSIFPLAMANLALEQSTLILAYAAMGLFALVMLVSFFRYMGRGAALNIALLTLFISLYAGYFLVNVMRRTGAPGMTPVDVGMSIFFLLYAMSGIGRTVTDSVEESRSRLRDFGPLFTFFLASGFFFVDSIIAVASTSGTAIWQWFQPGEFLVANNYVAFLFRDVAKLIAFPLTAIFSALYYLRVERTERIIERAKAKGETFEPGEVDEDLAEKAPEPGQPWPSERAEGIREGRQGHDLSAPDTDRMTVDRSRRLGKGKRFGEDDEDED